MVPDALAHCHKRRLERMRINERLFRELFAADGEVGGDPGLDEREAGRSAAAAVDRQDPELSAPSDQGTAGATSGRRRPRTAIVGSSERPGIAGPLGRT